MSDREQDNNTTNDLLVGLAIGGVIGAVAALLLAPKSGRELVNDISDQAKALTHYDEESCSSCSKESDIDEDESTMSAGDPLLWGSIAGTLLGAVTGLLLTPKAGRHFRSQLGEVYQDVSDRTRNLIESLNQKSLEISRTVAAKATGWADTTLELTDSASEEVKEWADAVKDAAAKARTQAISLGHDTHQQDKILEIMEWSAKASELADNVTKEVHKWVKSIHEMSDRLKKPRSKHSSNDNQPRDIAAEVAEWTLLGVNLWQNLRGRKR